MMASLRHIESNINQGANVYYLRLRAVKKQKERGTKINEKEER